MRKSGIPAQSVDLCLTDPPFAIDFKAKRGNYNRKDSRVLEGYCEVSGKDYLAFTRNWMTEVKRVLKEDGRPSKLPILPLHKTTTKLLCTPPHPS